MRPSNKSRNRNKNNNRRGAVGNNINRVFDSSGPEGRVRGTPQQIIDKYTSLTYDSQLSGDRVAAENFQQHAEHYSRLLIEAQKELAEKQTEQNATLANNKSIPKVIDEVNPEIGQSSNGVDKAEHKIVNFEKNLEKNPSSVDTVIDPVKPKKEPIARKVTKKRSSISSKPLEV
jgi:septal ring factor EnvC (AmiA/AmiB activator)